MKVVMVAWYRWYSEGGDGGMVQAVGDGGMVQVLVEVVVTVVLAQIPCTWR